MSKNNFNNINGNTLVFKFENQQALKHFKVWMRESGEQDYWAWMEYREDEEDGPITGLRFDYWSDGNKIKVECGRIDDPE